MAGCDSLPYTTSYHADLTQNLAGNPVYSPGYASLSGGSKKKGGYPPWFDNVPKNMSRKKYLRNLEEKKRLRELKKKSKGSKSRKTDRRTKKTKRRTRQNRTNKTKGKKRKSRRSRKSHSKRKTRK